MGREDSSSRRKRKDSKDVETLLNSLDLHEGDGDDFV